MPPGRLGSPILFLCTLLLADPAGLRGAAGGTHSKKRPPRRRGSEGGSSGQRCTICQAAVVEAQRHWPAAKSTKSGSPYHYIGGGGVSKTIPPEDRVHKHLRTKVCTRGFLSELPNPRGFAIHHPTLQWDCEDFLDVQSEAIVDALTLGESLASFCWDSDVCGSHDKKVFDLDAEDDDDADPEL
mmetsp:Transcript_19383/g.53219  ORF Transcript_19383/g.53219 Transcript_19383/m.53219 type:complete len:184 (+) Transcript_19383:68-619(+)